MGVFNVINYVLRLQLLERGGDSEVQTSPHRRLALSDSGDLPVIRSQTDLVRAGRNQTAPASLGYTNGGIITERMRQ